MKRSRNSNQKMTKNHIGIAIDAVGGQIRWTGLSMTILQKRIQYLKNCTRSTFKLPMKGVLVDSYEFKKKSIVSVCIHFSFRNLKYQAINPYF